MSSVCVPRAGAARLPGKLTIALLCGVWMLPGLAQAATPSPSDPIVKARAAFQHRDRASLAALRKSTAAESHPLAMWVDYWELSLRLRQAKPADLEAFYARWPDTAVVDLLRKNWIVERGKRGDAELLALELPRLRASAVSGSPDDREVECHLLLQRHAAGEDVAGPAHELWFAQRESDAGCAMLAQALFRAGHFTRDDVWARARLGAEQGRRFVVQHALALLGTLKMAQVHEAFLQPSRFLARRIAKPTPDEAELTALAAIRLAARSAPLAAAALNDARSTPLPAHAAAAAWAVVAKQAAIGLRPQAFEWYERAASVAGAERVAATAETLAWQVRTALRAPPSPQRWQMIAAAVDSMGSAQRADPTWTYWKARALQNLATPGAQGDVQRRAAQLLLASIAPRLHYYGVLAAQELGLAAQLPKALAPLTDEERAQAQNHPALKRGLALFELRLRDEGRAEWDHALAGASDRALRAAAQLACDAQAWNLCMTTSERTRDEIDMAQRFPLPYREAIDVAAAEADVDVANVYAVIRQESRFSAGARSVAGASGLMQLMPRTARWIATRYRIAYQRERIDDPATNVRIGARYFKLVLNGFDGSPAHAAAAYNAGPSRPRRWSKGGSDDAVAWTEIIPFNETRDYVKAVLFNAHCYAAILGNAALAKARKPAAPPEPEPTLADMLSEIGDEAQP
ncbi:MAG: lytic transglycosylase domain-containing protein [Burkholderiaceae bacterium]